MRNNILWAEGCNFATQCHCQCFINWKSINFNQFPRSYCLNLWVEKKKALSVPDSCGPNTVLLFPYNQQSSNCFLIEANCSASPGKWLESVFQFPTMTTGSECDCRPGSPSLQALVVLFLFFLFHCFYFSCVYCGNLKFCGHLSPPPRDRGPPMGACFSRRFALQTPKTPHCPQPCPQPLLLQKTSRFH